MRLSLAVAFTVALGCSSNTDVAPEQTGSSCTAPSQCYPGVADAGALKGTVLCLDRVSGGYCTHTCASDGDCCAATGECRTGFKQVCAPFESTGQQMCFLSCEDSDIKNALGGGTMDATAYCQQYANRLMGCRSTGGGSKNRKVCLP